MEMTPRPNRHLRSGVALVSAVILLLVMATISVTVLSMRTTEMGMDVDALLRLRAEAAATGALHLAAWTVQDRVDLQDALATVGKYEGDTWTAGADPLIRITGELSGATFTVDVWPRPNEARLRAQGVADGVYCERWSRLPVTQDDEAEETAPQIEPSPKKKKGKGPKELGPLGPRPGPARPNP